MRCSIVSFSVIVISRSLSDPLGWYAFDPVMAANGVLAVAGSLAGGILQRADEASRVESDDVRHSGRDLLRHCDLRLRSAYRLDLRSRRLSYPLWLHPSGQGSRNSEPFEDTTGDEAARRAVALVCGRRHRLVRRTLTRSALVPQSIDFLTCRLSYTHRQRSRCNGSSRSVRSEHRPWQTLCSRSYGRADHRYRNRRRLHLSEELWAPSSGTTACPLKARGRSFP